jgi:hypothetical protein
VVPRTSRAVVSQLPFRFWCDSIQKMYVFIGMERRHFLGRTAGWFLILVRQESPLHAQENTHQHVHLIQHAISCYQLVSHAYSEVVQEYKFVQRLEEI